LVAYINIYRYMVPKMGKLWYIILPDDLWIGSGHTYDVHMVRDGH
jgi:hypothetical protein